MKRLMPAVVAMTAVCVESVGVAADAPWLTGSQFERKLASSVSVLWSQNPLRAALTELGQVQRIAVYVDRRIDPGQELELNLRDVPVVEVFREVARYQKLDVAVLGDVVFVSLPETARRVWTVATLRLEDAEKFGPEVTRRFSAKDTFNWEDFATPRSILEELCETAGLEIVNLQRMPHDLWPAANLPPMPLVDRLTLVLEQFDMTFQLSADGRRLALVPVPDDVAIVRDYPGGARAAERLEAFRELAPNCQFEIARGRVYVKGLMEDHEKIAASLGSSGPASRDRPPSASPAPGERVFTARNTNVPLGAVLRSFAEQLGLELKIDLQSLQHAGVTPEQLISFEVEQASLDELFDAVLAPIGCTHEKRGNVLVVRAAE